MAHLLSANHFCRLKYDLHLLQSVLPHPATSYFLFSDEFLFSKSKGRQIGDTEYVSEITEFYLTF